MKQQTGKLTVSTGVLASMLRLSSRRIQQLVAAEILPRPSTGGHDLTVAVPAYIAFLQRPAQSASLSEAKLKKIEIETRLKQLDLQQRSGELVAKSATDAQFFAIGRRIRDTLFSLPDRLSGPLSGGMDQFKAHELLTREIRQALEGLTDEHTHADSTKKAPQPR